MESRKLLGRLAERATLEGLLEAVRAGRSGVLVIRGEPGIGKTALVDYAIEAAAGLQVSRVAGVESEMELAFAALQQLCAPMLHLLDRLPGPQRDALSVAFGLSAGATPDRFLVSLATLSLLSDAAAERPLLCAIDDAQWLDRASAQVLGFVGRRLLAEPVGLLVSAREPSADFTGLPELVVAGLSEPYARDLLSTALMAPLDDRVRERILAETRGNPLALLELPRVQLSTEHAGGFGVANISGLSQQLEDCFRQRIDSLPADARQLLLLAAAEPTGDPVLLWRAADRLGIEPDAEAAGEASSLISIGERVAFRHPLVRSAAYAAGSPEARQTVHAALADVTDQQADADRHAWHRAQAAARPDDAVAEELELSAGRARARGGYAAAGEFLQRSAALTLDPARRAERSLAAAHAKFQAGAWEATLGLLAAAEAGPLDDIRRAQLDLLHARIAFACSHGSDAPQLLLKAARQLEQSDMGLARDVYLEAVAAAMFASRLATGADLREVAEAALAVPSPRPPRAPDLLLNGLALLITEGHSAAAPVLKRALQAFRTIDVSEEEGLGWLWLACGAAGHVWDYESWDVLSARMVDVVRNTGALTALPIAYSTRAGVHKFAGEFALAASLVSEVEVISEVIGSNIAPYASLALAAFQGREADALALIEAGTKDVLQRGEGEGLTFIQWATAVLCNGLGRYQDALAAAELASEDTPAIWFTNWALVELIEAATRTDERDLAVSALNRLSETTRASATDWAVGVEARSRALVSEGTAAESCYKQAIDSLGRTPLRVELARAHLLYGEWLRRQQRRRDARDQLHVAHGTLELIGAAAFAGRARQELRATGEHVRKRTVDTQAALTAQEALIARIAARGASNSQIAAQLFISPATVAYHLRKVFAKLDVGSRHELARKVEAQQPSSQSVLLPSG